MQYVYEGRIYEIDYVRRNENDEAEIFLIDMDTRQAVSIDDLPDYVADELYSVCADLIYSDVSRESEE